MSNMKVTFLSSTKECTCPRAVGQRWDVLSVCQRSSRWRLNCFSDQLWAALLFAAVTDRLAGEVRHLEPWKRKERRLAAARRNACVCACVILGVLQMKPERPDWDHLDKAEEGEWMDGWKEGGKGVHWMWWKRMWCRLVRQKETA